MNKRPQEKQLPSRTRLTRSEAEQLNKLENKALTPRVKKLFRALDAQGATAEERRAAIRQLLLPRQSKR